jgi:hypothetical protein
LERIGEVEDGYEMKEEREELKEEGKKQVSTQAKSLKFPRFLRGERP